MTVGGKEKHIVVILSSNLVCDNVANDYLVRLSKGRNTSFVLVASKPKQLLSLYPVLSQGKFDHLVVNGDSRYLVYDAVNYCRRLSSGLVHIYYINRNEELTSFYSCEAFGGSIKGQNSVSVEVDKLKLLSESVLLSFERLKAALEGKLIPKLKLDTDDQCSAFTTQNCIRRLGNLETLKQSSLALGEYQANQYSNWCILDDVSVPQLSSDKLSIRWPYYSDTGNQDCMLFDLQPVAEHPLVYASSCFDVNSLPRIRLPRFIMVGRKVPKLNFNQLKNKPPAIFVMSSYNKEQYILAAIWSVLMQTYENVRVEVVDDNSSDNSIGQIKLLLSLLPSLAKYVGFHQCTDNKGTYAIRNQVIAALEPNSIYYVNDADDISSAQRAKLQATLLSVPDVKANIGNIVRVDSNYRLLCFDDHIEHYGSASLCSTKSVHEDIGYYQSLKRGADTEFINRITRAWGANAFYWFHYPLLFQTFGKSNLTEDIYQLINNQLLENIVPRKLLKECFDKFHEQTTVEQMATLTPSNRCLLPSHYKELTDEFFVDKQRVEWADLLEVQFELTPIDLLKSKKEQGFAYIAGGNAESDFVLESGLEESQHDYIFLSNFFDPKKIIPKTDVHPHVYFESRGNLGISFVLVYQDAKGEQISHQFFWANHKMPVKMPAACESIKLGFRLQGAGSVEVKRICFTTLQKPE
ncbi:glycosyltransferase family A protein [Aliiglaciecola lipolytica]|uniref:Glycosyltransferase 2-like domain-containing protein n=1 Tax=Aliiglaciecola lipolytica E3 TaxID=1127673 RepID=K6WY35_9ALTE|nr:glycosyltransferase family A protein [Aliiglaciecola lipolytica]GAC13359.1 hypothetical protein GLIP_0713 [Aliiglaciecola lipolytica E3]